MIAYYESKPDELLYMPLPDGRADVWLRKNIAQAEQDGQTVWTAEEVYFRTVLTKERVEVDFDMLFEMGEPPKPAHVSDTERLDALEAAILELAEVIANG